MLRRQAFADEKLVARGFATGDVVRKTNLHDLIFSPYVGRVLYANPEIGKISVQWPWGVEQESPLELTRDISGDFVPPLLTDQSYSTWESARHTHDELSIQEDNIFRKTVASQLAHEFNHRNLVHNLVRDYEKKTLPIWRAACEAWHKGADEVEAFQKLSGEFGEEFGHDPVRLTVQNLYGLGRRLAIYWKDNKRRYRVTQKEKASGKVSCPRCKNLLKPRVFRQGQRVLSCSKCGFSISKKDLVASRKSSIDGFYSVVNEYDGGADCLSDFISAMHKSADIYYTENKQNMESEEYEKTYDLLVKEAALLEPLLPEMQKLDEELFHIGFEG